MTRPSNVFQIVRNFAALLLSTGVQRLSNFLLTLYIARVLGVNALGQFTIVMSLLLIFQTIASMGQQHIAVREIARAPEELVGYLLNGSCVVILGGLVCTLLMFVITHLIGYDVRILQYVYIAGLSVVPGVLTVVAESVLQGRQQMHYIMVAQTSGGFFKLALSLGLLYLGFGLRAVFGALVLSNVVLYGIYLWIIRGSFSVRRASLDWGKVRSLLRMAGTFIVISIFGVVFKQVDVLMLGSIRDTEAVGIYSAAFRLIQIGMQLLPPLMLALFPRMSEVYMKSPERLGRMAEQVLRLLLVFVLPLTAMVTILADRILLLFYGVGYEQSAPILRILAWMFTLFSINAVLYRTMIASDNEWVTMRVAGVNMVVSLLLNLILIPAWGAIGVSLVSLFTIAVAVVQNYGYISRNLFEIRWLRLLGKPTCASLLSGGLLLIMRAQPLFLSLPLVLSVYGGLIVVLKIFPREDLWLVRRAWRESMAKIL
jgi:O-antigen/teichoic acid export membrane protein